MQEDTTSHATETASTKPFWKSKTIVGVLPVVIASAAPSLGFELGDDEAQNLVQLISALASLILVIIGRRSAKKGITLK